MSPVMQRSTIAVAALLAFSGIAIGQTLPVNTTDLGQSLPRTADVSANPAFHVYVFLQNGIEYVQINDALNTPRAAVGVANGTILPLPIGVDSSRVSFGSISPQSTTTGATTKVYSDNQIQVAMIPQQGGFAWNISLADGAQNHPLATSNPAPATCTIVDCGNPVTLPPQ